MTISLSPGGRTLLVAAAVTVAAALITPAAKLWYADRLEHSPKLADRLRAAKLEPRNADYQDRIGLYLLSQHDAKGAIGYFRAAVRIDPLSDQYWMDMASACETAGLNDESRDAYEKALAAQPASPDVAWQYGSFLLRRGETEKAAHQIRRALSDRPELAASAVAEFWRAGVSFDQILGTVLPPRSDEYEAAVDYFVTQQRDDEALASWEKLVGLGVSFPLGQSFDLINTLIAYNRIADAAGVWRQAVVAGGQASRAGSGGSLIFNGGFERDPANGGFDWRWSPVQGTAFDLVTDEVHSGQRSARIAFDGSANVGYDGLQEYVATTPGRQYHFSAFMRTDAITTDSGPQFAVLALSNARIVLATTPAMTGTHPWTQVRADFTTGPEIYGVIIVLRRLPSTMFDNKIRGAVWVDDVSLTEVSRVGGLGQEKRFGHLGDPQW